MSSWNSTLTAVLQNWADRISVSAQVEALGNAGGFSGATFWRVSTSQKIYCLRRWPQQHPRRDRLHWIHQVLGFVSERSNLPLALPIPTIAGTSMVLYADHLWELSPWLPGEPVAFLSTSEAQLSSADVDLYQCLQTAMQALAKFHKAASDCPFPEDGIEEKKSTWGISPGLESRAKKITQVLQADFLSDLRAHVLQKQAWPAGAALAFRILEKIDLLTPGIYAEVQSVLRFTVPLQPCVRDIWSDHLLFTGDQITGWVDFGAMQMETPSGDIARLLGSMAGDEPARWLAGLEAYAAIRPLSDLERLLVRTFDACQVLLAGLNWIQWIFREQRKFERLDQIEGRLRNIDHRLSYRLRTPESLS